VGAVGRLARRRPPDDQFPIAPRHEQRLVRVALLVALDLVGVSGPQFPLEKRLQDVDVDEPFEVLLALFGHGRSFAGAV
jgi:hypothetical protein